MVDLTDVAEVEGLAEKHGVPPSTKLLAYDFVLVSEEEVSQLRHARAQEALESQGMEGMRIVNGLPVPEVD